MMRTDELNAVKEVLSMEVEGYKGRGRPKKKMDILRKRRYSKERRKQ